MLRLTPWTRRLPVASSLARGGLVLLLLGAMGRASVAPAGIEAPPAVAQATDAVNNAPLKDTPGIKALFRPVIAQAGLSTVQITCEQKPVALGVIVRADGMILTKASELRGPVTVTLPDGRRLAAVTVAVSLPHDLALLQVPARDLRPVVWHAEAAVPVGAWLATPGHRQVDPVAIGVMSVATRCIRSEGGFLGVQTQEEDGRGVRIVRVVPGSPAEAAGLQVDDVLLSVSDGPTRTRKALMDRMRSLSAGDRVTLCLRRGEAPVQRHTALGLPPVASDAKPSRGQFQNATAGALSARHTGFPCVFQHDTVLTPQECGGPVVDLDGHVVGLNIARAGRTETYALPASTVQAVLRELLPAAR